MIHISHEWTRGVMIPLLILGLPSFLIWLYVRQQKRKIDREMLQHLAYQGMRKEDLS